MLAKIIFMFIIKNMDIHNNISFTSKKEVRMAHDVCHRINQELPHVSPTKLYCMCENAGRRVGNASRYAPERIVYKNGCYAYEQASRRLNKMRMLEKYSVDVSTPYLKARNAISQIKEHKVANCAENAEAAEVILKMNGIKNACCITPENVDHTFCVFSRDGSKFNGQITNQAIVIDPLTGIVDFIGNALKKMKNTLGYCKNIRVQKKELKNIEINEINLSENDILQLKKDFPELVLKKRF